MARLDNVTEGIVTNELARMLCVCALLKHELSGTERQGLREVLCDGVSTIAVTLGISSASVAAAAKDIAARLEEVDEP